MILYRVRVDMLLQQCLHVALKKGPAPQTLPGSTSSVVHDGLGSVSPRFSMAIPGTLGLNDAGQGRAGRACQLQGYVDR
jgi:hypothetical protein